MDHSLILTGDGSPTRFHPQVGEHYHSLSGAHLEALHRFVLPCRIVETARHRGRVRIIDVGFGLGTNVGWAIHVVQREVPGAVVEIVSFERDLLPLEQLRGHFRALPEARLSSILGTLVERGEWRQGALDVQLIEGDVQQQIASVEGPYDAVFLDPFSPKRNPGPWKSGFLAALRERMSENAILSTYSSARRIRLALLRGGWQIGLGPAVGMKSSGTLACAGSAIPPLPELDAKLSQKLQRQLARAWEEETG